jgi:copper chaperone CopZ
MKEAAGTYVHVLNGRLRIKVPEVKGSTRVANVVTEAVSALPGIADVTANHLTGNVLVLYNSAVCSPDQIVACLKGLNCLSVPLSALNPQPVYRRVETLGSRLAEAAIRSTLEIAVSRLLTAIL